MRKAANAILCAIFSLGSAAAATAGADLSSQISDIKTRIPSASSAVKEVYDPSSITPLAQTGKRIDSPNSTAIMLQGFHWFADSYWYHPPNGWWGVLAEKAPEIGKAGFNLIWFPPAANGSYYPNEWYNFNGQWGTQPNMIKAIGAMHANGVKVIADIVLNHRNGKSDWADFKNPDWPTYVIVQDDEWPGKSSEANNGKSPSYDEGQGDGGCRDLDHRNPIVQTDTMRYLQYLRTVIKFDGWRYDMVKGFWGGHIADYNRVSAPEYSVGEYYDTNRQTLVNWIDTTDQTNGKANASSAFDFTTRYNIVNAAESGHYEILNDGGRASGLIGWWPAKATTFVDNHDTAPRDVNFMSNSSTEYRVQRVIGYAYILTHPGIPCVFWAHYFDLGDTYKKQIQKLVDIRRQAGITNTSPLYIAAAQQNLYAAIVTGQKQQVAVKLGSSWDWNPPGQGWTLAASGDRYAVWTK